MFTSFGAAIWLSSEHSDGGGWVCASQNFMTDIVKKTDYYCYL